MKLRSVKIMLDAEFDEDDVRGMIVGQSRRLAGAS
jgi:hypothetical protein